MNRSPDLSPISPASSLAALVTGSSAGIGRAIALRLSRDGFHVIVQSRKNRAGAEETQSMIRAAGGTADVLTFDVSDSAAAETALEGYFKSQPERTLSALI